MVTKKQKQVLDFITDFQSKKGYAPALEEIRKKFKLASVSTAHFHVSKLQNLGLLAKEANRPRSIGILNKDKTTNVPILGTIAAGQPIEAIEVPDETIAITSNELGKHGNYYALRVRGNSMIDEGIFDGDIVIIRKQEIAADGQTVVAIIDDNQATLKKIYKENGRFRLQPANQGMLPLYRKEVEVRGVVIKIIRNLEGRIQETVLSVRKKTFLNRIKSSNEKSQNQYKRVTLSPLRYAGGKSLAVGHIVELIPDNVKKVVSPFFGGGSVEIAIAKELGVDVVGYDIFDILMNYWHYQISQPDKLAEKLKDFKPNRQEYVRIKEIMKKHWKGEKKLKGIDLAAVYYFNHNTSYGPHFLGSPSSVYLQKKRYDQTIQKVKNFDVKNIKVSCDSFENVIPKHKSDFLYCDPPYYLDGDSKMFIGMYPHRNFPIHHKGFKHEKLRDLLKSHKGGFILSYNDCSTIRDWYKDFNIIAPTWQYTFSQGDTRIGHNRINKNNGSHIKKSHEVIIWKNPE